MPSPCVSDSENTFSFDIIKRIKPRTEYLLADPKLLS